MGGLRSERASQSARQSATESASKASEQHLQAAQDQSQEAGESDEYRQTVEKLTGILEERRGKYSFADIRVPLQSEEHGSLAAEAVVVAYR